VVPDNAENLLILEVLDPIDPLERRIDIVGLVVYQIDSSN
jgi:hypothetical protein